MTTTVVLIPAPRASSPCRAPGLGLEQGSVPLIEPAPGTPHSEQVLVVALRREYAPALSWTELSEVRWQVPPQLEPELPLALPALEWATPWRLLWVFWLVSLPQVRRLAPPSPEPEPELPSILEGTQSNSNTLPWLATTETLAR